MTLTTLHALAAAKARVFASAEYKLSQSLLILFPRLQVAHVPVAPPVAPAVGVVSRGTATLFPSRFAFVAAAEEGAKK